MLQSCRKTAEVAGSVLELQKFINGGSSPENSANSAQMFLRSKRSSRINLAQKEIQIKEESELQKEPSQLEVLLNLRNIWAEFSEFSGPDPPLMNF